ncbi:MAG TPA: hypothetical protein VGG98_04295 [Solirubrobacteraceae bacterium]
MIRTKSLATLAAVALLAALGAASASAALPEFTAGGKFPITLSGSGTQPFIEELGGAEYQCEGGTGSTITGTISGPKEVSNILIKFPRCASWCRTVATEAFETKALTGTLAYINKSQKTVGLLLHGVSEPLAKCTFWSGASTVIGGSIIGQVSPVNNKTSLVLSFIREPKQARQKVQSLEGESLLHDLTIEHLFEPPARTFGLGVSITFGPEIEVRA